MEEKSLGQIAREVFMNGTGPTTADDWEKAADAVLAAAEARRWKAIEAFGDVQIAGTVGGWFGGKWDTVSGWLDLPYWRSRRYTHVLTPPTAIPAPPQEVEREA